MGVLTAGAGAWSVSAQSCCERKACENIRFLNAQIAMNYAMCCQKPEAERSACLTETQSKVNATLTLIITAKQACDNGDDALVRDTIKQIRDIWLPKIIKTATGAVVNQMVAFGSQDYLEVDATLVRTRDGCAPVTVVIVGDVVVNPEATGLTTENLHAVTHGDGPEVAVVIPRTARETYTSCTYSVPANTSFNMRFGDTWNGLSLGGTISIAQTAPAFPVAGVATVGLPTDVSLTANYFGQTITLQLDKTSPHNALRTDAAGNGVLAVALHVDSNSPMLGGFIQIGSTIYFEFPVQVSQNWSTVRLHANAGVPGHLITPTDPDALAGADTPQGPVIAEDPCTDNDGNGIRDGADEAINAINSQLNCQGTAQH